MKTPIYRGSRSTAAQQAARSLPRFEQPDPRPQQEKDDRLLYLRAQFAYELEDTFIENIVASNLPVYHRLQLLLGIRADRGYCALLKRVDCNITSNDQLIFAISSFVPELDEAYRRNDYDFRAEAIEKYLRHQHESNIGCLLRKLFTGELDRGRTSPTQQIVVPSTCAGCLRQVSISFSQGPMHICEHCLPLWLETSERYMSE